VFFPAHPTVAIAFGVDLDPGLSLAKRVYCHLIATDLAQGRDALARLLG